MVNQIILEYLRKYSLQYSNQDLKQKILSSGYSEKDFDEALLALKSEAPEMVPKSGNYPLKYSKWLKIAGICGIIMLVFLFASSISVLIFPQSSNILSIFLVVFSFVFLLSSLFFFYGFIALGKKYGKKFIQVISWIIIIFETLAILFLFILFIFPDSVRLFFQPLPNLAISYETLITNLFSTLGMLAFILLFIFLAYLIVAVLFSIGLITLRNDVKYAKIVGILNIIGLCTLIFGIGILILLVSFIFEIVFFFRESKRQN